MMWFLFISTPAVLPALRAASPCCRRLSRHRTWGGLSCLWPFHRLRWRTLPRPARAGGRPVYLYPHGGELYRTVSRALGGFFHSTMCRSSFTASFSSSKTLFSCCQTRCESSTQRPGFMLLSMCQMACSMCLSYRRARLVQAL